jgi:rubrerythrin
MDRSEFDLDKYLRASKRVDLSGLPWQQIKDHPVTPAEARTLAYMMDIESHTVIFLRDLLATRAALEPDVTAFLSCWVYEELWHGEAFSRFLGEVGYSLAPDGERVHADAPYPTRSARNSWIRRKLHSKGYASHVGTMVGSTLTRDFPALHMTWGAVNELSTLQGYHRMIAKTENPVLVDLLTRIIKDERRHFAFYRAQARVRLARSAKARRITRWALERLWAPVGTGVRPQDETDFAVAYIFGDEEGHRVAEEMDGVIAELPGMAGLRIYRDELERTLRRIGPRFERMRMATPLAAFRS